MLFSWSILFFLKILIHDKYSQASVYLIFFQDREPFQTQHQICNSSQKQACLPQYLSAEDSVLSFIIPHNDLQLYFLQTTLAQQV